MEKDWASVEKATQLEAQLAVYRDALQRIEARLMENDSEFSRIIDAIMIAKFTLDND